MLDVFLLPLFQKMTIILFTIFALGVFAVENFETPLTYDSSGNLFVNVQTGIPSSPTAMMQLALGSFSSICLGIPYGSEDLEISFTNSENDDHRFPTLLTRCIRNALCPTSFLRVGPTSQFLSTVNSVAIIKDINQAHLVLNSTMSAFNETCVPGSLLNLDFNSGTIFVNFALANETHIEQYDGPRLLIMNQVGNYKMSVPEPLFNRIDELLVQTGAHRLVTLDSESPRMYSNCSVESTYLLPAIRTSLTDLGANFVLFPEDYIKFDSSTNSCVLRVIDTSSSGYVWIDPFRLVDTNVRINRDNTYQICDTSGF